MNSSAVQPCSAKTRRMAAFTRSTVSGSPSSQRVPSRFSAARSSAIAGREPRLGRALRPADPLELGADLVPAALVEDVLVDRQLDARLPDPVEVRAGKVAGTTACARPAWRQARVTHSSRSSR